MNTPFTDRYDRQFLIDTMMGPNAMRITEELAGRLPIIPGMRILDLGCGTGISSILLAEKHGATVFAADLWIPPTENAERFTRLGLDSTIIPLSIDATKEIPFAHGYFDMIVSVDAWQYFGCNEDMLPKLLPFLKKRGLIAVVVPGFIDHYDEGNLPKEVEPFWAPNWYFHPLNWWKTLWEKEPRLKITSVREMDSCGKAWDDFMECPMAQEEMVPIMKAGAGHYFNLIELVGQKI